MTDDALYRPCVGVMLANRDGRVLVAERLDAPGAWQMPQGGVDPGETPRQAALRELLEEIGTDRAEIVAESADWLRYDLPDELRARVWGGRYRGQRQKWFLMRFLGQDADIDLTRHSPEFARWRWAEIEELPAAIVVFKRPVYEALVAEFGPRLKAMRGGIGALALGHVQILTPRAREDETLAFYRDVLGLLEISQPAAQAARGGAWFAVGGAELHVKPDDVEVEEARRSRRHVCLIVGALDRAEAALRAAGAEFLPDNRPIPGVRRLFVRDPGGNRLEIAETASEAGGR